MRSLNAAKSVCVQSCTILLMYLLQGSKKIDLAYLITLLAELSVCMEDFSAHNRREEAERLEKLTRFLAHPYRFIESS